MVFCGEPESLLTLHVTNFLDLCTLLFYKYSSHPPISIHNQNTRRFYSILSVICFSCYYRPISVFVAMSLLTDLVNLNLSETTDKVIAEYIWFVFFLHKIVVVYVLDRMHSHVDRKLNGFMLFFQLLTLFLGFVWSRFC